MEVGLCKSKIKSSNAELFTPAASIPCLNNYKKKEHGWL